MKDLNFETVNAKIEAINFDELEQNMEISMKAERADVSSVICNIWKKIDGVVRIIADFTIFPKWRRALKLLITTMDRICGMQ